MKPKILIIGPTPPPYHGVAISTRLILDSPALHRFRICHLDTSDRRDMQNIGAFEWGNIILGLRHFFRFSWVILRFRPRLIYLPISQGTGGYLRDLLFLLPARWLGVKTVVHLRGSEFQTFYKKSSAPMRALIRYSLERVRRVVVLGDNLRAIFDRLVPPERVVVIPNGTEDFSASPRVRNRDGKVRGLYLSNLRPRKGFLVTFEASIETLRCFPNLEFAFAGDWQSDDVRRQVMARLQGYDVADRIHFLGVVIGEEKHRLLMDSDFFVFPPVEPEGHPRVVLEAMAAGLPIIATAQGAIVETVVEGETGYFVEPGNVSAIVNKITYWMENPAVMRAMGQAARQRFLAHYTAEISNERLAALFTEVLEED